MHHQVNWYGEKRKQQNKKQHKSPYERHVRKSNTALCGNQGSPQPGAPSHRAGHTGKNLTSQERSQGQQLSMKSSTWLVGSTQVFHNVFHLFTRFSQEPQSEIGRNREKKRLVGSTPRLEGVKKILELVCSWGHHGFQLLSCPLLVLLGWVWSRWTPWFFIRNSSAGNTCFTTCRAVSCGCENLTSVVR